MSAITGIATFIRSKARWNWSASSTTVPTPAVRDTAKPRAPKSKQASLHLIGRSAGTFSAGSDIDGSLDIGRFPKSETNSSMLTGSNSPTRASAITSIATRPCWPREQDPAALRQQYARVDELILTIDGLQPEKGHETLYVVRELTQKRVWFAEPLLSATADEVRRLIKKAKEWAELLSKPVGLWLSDKQDAFVTGIAAEFPDVPHRYCDNHFLRDVAKPVLEADSHAKVQMRRKVRGLRKIEQAVLKQQSAQASQCLVEDDPEATVALIVEPANAPAPEVDSVNTVVLDYCAAVRGILNDDQGGPLHPPGLRMADALDEVRESIQRNLDEKKGGSRKSNSAAWPTASTEVWTEFGSNKKSSGIRQGHQRGRRDPRTRRANLRGTAGDIRQIERSIQAY